MFILILRDEVKTPQAADLACLCVLVHFRWYDQAASWTRRAQAEVCLPRLPGPAPAAEKARQHYDSTASNAHSNKGDTSSSRFQVSGITAADPGMYVPRCMSLCVASYKVRAGHDSRLVRSLAWPLQVLPVVWHSQAGAMHKSTPVNLR